MKKSESITDTLKASLETSTALLERIKKLEDRVDALEKENVNLRRLASQATK
ncbi:MAG: hypothetical protein WC878_02670 [Candidatus Paceibacterota bacterium]|jgi:hypothetical protein